MAYNDANKTVLKVLNLPLTIASIQLGLGLVLYVAPLWLSGLRKMPKLSGDNVKSVMPVALIHGAGQLVTVMSLGAGSLAFVNVVKSLEVESTARKQRPLCSPTPTLMLTPPPHPRPRPQSSVPAALQRRLWRHFHERHPSLASQFVRPHCVYLDPLGLSMPH